MDLATALFADRHPRAAVQEEAVGAARGGRLAPDGSRAGLVWQSECAPYFQEIMAPGLDRWGVWAAGLALPMTTSDEARDYLAALLPHLRSRWEAWRDAGNGPRWPCYCCAFVAPGELVRHAAATR